MGESLFTLSNPIRRDANTYLQQGILMSALSLISGCSLAYQPSLSSSEGQCPSNLLWCTLHCCCGASREVDCDLIDASYSQKGCTHRTPQTSELGCHVIFLQAHIRGNFFCIAPAPKCGIPVYHAHPQLPLILTPRLNRSCMLTPYRVTSRNHIILGQSIAEPNISKDNLLRQRHQLPPNPARRLAGHFPPNRTLRYTPSQLPDPPRIVFFAPRRPLSVFAAYDQTIIADACRKLYITASQAGADSKTSYL